MASARDHVLWPSRYLNTAPGGLPSLATLVLDGATDIIEWIFQAETADQITTLVVSVASVATPAAMQLSLHDVDATTGRAGATTHASGSVAAPVAGANTVTIAYTPTRGQLLCLKATSTGATVSNTITVNTRSTGHVNCTDVVWQNGVEQSNTQPIYGYRTATRSYGFCPTDVNYDAFNGTEERGFKFTPAAGWSDTLQIGAIGKVGRQDTANGTIEVNLYTSGGASVAATDTMSRDSDTMVIAVSGSFDLWVLDTLYTQTLGNSLWIAWKATTSTTRIIYYQFATAGDAAACGAETFTYINRASSAAAFTETTTRIPMGCIVLEDITEPTGGGSGGLMTHPGMAGGMRG